MTLKTATSLVVVSLIIQLVISVSQWVIWSFDFLNYSEYRWPLRGIGLASMLVYSVPMIIFFSVLNSKQKGQ